MSGWASSGKSFPATRDAADPVTWSRVSLDAETDDHPFELAVVGGGNMGAALVGGLLASGAVVAAALAVVEVSAVAAPSSPSCSPASPSMADIPPCDAALIAVKPLRRPGRCRGRRAAGATRLLSIAAGIPLATLAGGRRSRRGRRARHAEHAGPRAARARPRSPLAPPPTDATSPWAEAILGAVGIVVRVPEHQLDAVTGLAGRARLSVPRRRGAHRGAVCRGPVARRRRAVGHANCSSARRRCSPSAGDPAELASMVTSPGGTTAAGLRVLEEHGVRSAFLEPR